MCLWVKHGGELKTKRCKAWKPSTEVSRGVTCQFEFLIYSSWSPSYNTASFMSSSKVLWMCCLSSPLCVDTKQMTSSFNFCLTEGTFIITVPKFHSSNSLDERFYP